MIHPSLFGLPKHLGPLMLIEHSCRTYDVVNEKHSASGLLHSDVDTCVVLTVSSTVVAELIEVEGLILVGSWQRSTANQLWEVSGSLD